MNVHSAWCRQPRVPDVGPARADRPVNEPPTGRCAIACYVKKQPNANCEKAAISNINRPHEAEGLAKIVLPADSATQDSERSMSDRASFHRNLTSRSVSRGDATNDRSGKRE
jgi:hypothetical protein